MIEVSHLCKRYQGTVALDDVSFTVESGSICGLLGPNGAGKSTTMNIMCGCLSATSGEVRYDGAEIYADMREAKREIGYLPEIPPLYPEMTPREYLSFVADAKGLTAAEARDAVEGLSARCGLTDASDRLIANLSKGYRQRVGIASALVGNPRFVVLDEPTVGLDPIQIVEIRDLIRGLAPKHTVLVSSHILSEVRSICDRIVMISHGRLVADDTPENLERHSGTGSTLTILVEASRADLGAALADLACVKRVQIAEGEEPGTVSAVIEGAVGEDLRAPVSRALGAKGILILGMSRSTATLEDAFIELVGTSGTKPAGEDLDATEPLPALDGEDGKGADDARDL